VKSIEKELRTLSKSLAALSRRVDDLIESVSRDSGRTPSPARRRPARAGARRKKVNPGAATLADRAYEAIKRTRNGITIARLKAKTELESKRLSNVLYKLTKNGLVETKSRGAYFRKWT
jgi:hypothetical protein